MQMRPFYYFSFLLSNGRKMERETLLVDTLHGILLRRVCGNYTSKNVCLTGYKLVYSFESKKVAGTSVSINKTRGLFFLNFTNRYEIVFKYRAVSYTE